MNYWQFKFKDELWENFQKLEIGDTFTTTITDKEKNKLDNRIGDIVFWYRTGAKKNIINGIYLVTEFVSNVREDEEYTNNYSVEMRIIESHKDSPCILEDNGFAHIIEKTKKGNFFQYIRYLFNEDDNGAELHELLKQNNKKLNKLKELNKNDYQTIEKIKEGNINSGNLFNPFLDMNLIKLEVKHLSFITNLLNPRGTHHQGDKFFKNFIQSLSEYEEQVSNVYLKNMINSNNHNLKIEAEKNISNSSDNEKGRIDIYIENDEYIIAIEGKIESKDHDNQLMKYDKFLKKQNKPYLLIYLTKEGEESSKKAPDNLQLMCFKVGIKDFIDYSLEEDLPEKIKTTLNEYQKSLTTYLNKLEPTWSYTLDIMEEITKGEESFKKYQNMKDIYYRNPDKYRFSVVEDVAFYFEKSKAYIEMKFFYELYKNIEDMFEKYKSDFKVIEDESTIKIDEDNKLSKMINMVHIYQQRKRRLNPIKKRKDSEDILLDLGLVGFSLKWKDKLQEQDLNIMNTTVGIFVDEFPYSNKEFIDICVPYDCRIEPDIFYSKNISKLLDKKYMQVQVDKVMKNIDNSLNIS